MIPHENLVRLIQYNKWLKEAHLFSYPSYNKTFQSDVLYNLPTMLSTVPISLKSAKTVSAAIFKQFNIQYTSILKVFK